MLTYVVITVFILILLTMTGKWQTMNPPTVFRIVIWVLLKLINILYIPIFIQRLFKKRKYLPSIDDNILLTSATDLAERIRKREVKSEYVIKAYIKRIKEVNPIINAVVDERFDKAIEEAKEVDNFLAKSNLTEQELRQKFPLLGVPITVKGSIALEGLSYNSGSLVRNVCASEDADVVRQAKEAGAIPLLVSTTPELCMNWETVNKTTGITFNPYDTTRTVGGSSGGECALLSSGASVIGLGSDIAGSLRLPAHFCGVYGHKPSPGLVSLEGHFPNCTDKESWEKCFTLGPLARYVEDLELLLKCIVKPSKAELLDLEKPVKVEDIRVYYMYDHGSLLQPNINENIKTAIQKAVFHLQGKTKGKIEKINIKNLNYAGELSYLHMLAINGVEHPFTDREDQIYSEVFKFFTCRSKYTMTPVLYALYKKLLYKPFKRYELHIEKTLNSIREHFLEILKNDGVVICPTFTSEAHLHHDIYRKLFSPSYLSIYNSLGFPVTNCHVMFTKERLPVGVQIVAAPNCDRLTLTVAKELAKAFGGWQKPPSSNDIHEL